MAEIGLYSIGVGAIVGFLAGLLRIAGVLRIVPALIGLITVHGFPPKLIMLMALATSLATITFTSAAEL